MDRLERNTRTVTLFTLLSRMTGLARDAALSRVFGVGPVMDAFAFAFMLPNLFRRLFGEGALSAAFLPVYTHLDATDPKAARQLAALLTAMLVAVLGGLTLLGELVLGGLLLGAGGDHLTLRLMMITLPYMPLVCLVAILGSILQVHGRFGPTAASPVILNLAIVGAAVGSMWLPVDSAETDPLPARAVIVAAAIGVAGLLQLAWSLWVLRDVAIEWRQPWIKPLHAFREAWRNGLRDVLTKAGPMILGLGVLQVNTFVDGLIASWPSTIGPTIFGIQYPLEQGALATLGYAQRLYEFPLGVFGIAVATAIFPLLAKQAATPAPFLATLRRGVRLVAFIGVPASIGLMVTSVPLTAVVLQGGDFGADDTRRVAFVLLGYAPAIWAYSMNHTLIRGLYAMGDSVSPVRISLWMVLLNFTLNCTLIWTPLREAGLAWSTALCAVLQMLLLARVIRQRLSARINQPIIDRAVGISLLKTTALSMLMGAPVWLLARSVLAGGGAEGRSWHEMLLLLSGCVLLGGAVFALGAVLLRMPELRWALGGRDQR